MELRGTNLELRGTNLELFEQTRGDLQTVPPAGVTRGTSNGNARGSAEGRRRRREWLVQTYRANRDVVPILMRDGSSLLMDVILGTEGARAACRCYRCGLLLTTETVTVDRIKPGCQGGTYRRDNIRPACGRCNSETGGSVRSNRGK